MSRSLLLSFPSLPSFQASPASSWKLRTNERTPPRLCCVGSSVSFPPQASEQTFQAHLAEAARREHAPSEGKHNTAHCWGGRFQNGHSLQRQCGPADKPPETRSFRRIWLLQSKAEGRREKEATFEHIVRPHNETASAHTHTITNTTIKT